MAKISDDFSISHTTKEIKYIGASFGYVNVDDLLEYLGGVWDRVEYVLVDGAWLSPDGEDIENG